MARGFCGGAAEEFGGDVHIAGLYVEPWVGSFFFFWSRTPGTLFFGRGLGSYEIIYDNIRQYRIIYDNIR